MKKQAEAGAVNWWLIIAMSIIGFGLLLWGLTKLLETLTTG